ncbi:MAG TPA: hypothetical protein VFM73_08285 [Xanthomonadaceae bacterium]|nr:hypothetical protein [Xanthomonadaceae bacterium]
MVRMSHIIALAISLAVAPAMADDRDIDKVNGSITADAGEQYGSLSTVNGSIRIEAGASVGAAETVNGAIRVADDARAGSLATVNGSIRLGTGVEIDGDLETVNGSVFVDRAGRVDGDVETVNGSIGLVDTDLAGGIATVNGDITVGIGSHVRGGITVEKPDSNWFPFSFGKREPQRIVIAQDARVDGPLVFERDVKLYVHATAEIGPVTGATAVRYEGSRAPRD